MSNKPSGLMKANNTFDPMPDYTAVAAPHDILSHSDALAGTVTRGDIIVGNSTPKWSRLAKGTAGTYLRSDGIDAAWSALQLVDLPNHNLLSTTHGDTVAASPARGDIIVANSTPAWTRLAKGASGTYLRSDGTDPSYSILSETELFQGRLDLTSSTQITLLRHNGGKIVVGTEYVDPGSGLILVTTDNLITSTGVDAGGAMAANTLYYLYVSNSLASFAPIDLRASTTAPSLVGGVYYLGSSGNALNWRFAGLARTNGSVQVEDNTTNRLLLNYYNRKKKTLLAAPGYIDGNSFSSYTTSSTAWTPANGGTGSRISFLSFGSDNEVEFHAHFIADPSVSQIAALGISALDSTTDTKVMTQTPTGARGIGSISWSTLPTDGYHTCDLLVRVSGGVGIYYADNERGGAVSDPYLTYLHGIVWL